MQKLVALKNAGRVRCNTVKQKDIEVCLRLGRGTKCIGISDL